MLLELVKNSERLGIDLYIENGDGEEAVDLIEDPDVQESGIAQINLINEN